MTSKQSAYIVAAVLAVIVMGIVSSINTQGVYANGQPTPEPTVAVQAVPAVTAEDGVAEPERKACFVFVPFLGR